MKEKPPKPKGKAVEMDDAADFPEPLDPGDELSKKVREIDKKHRAEAKNLPPGSTPGL
jgi:hypothetical protein